MSEKIILRAYVTNSEWYKKGMLMGEWIDFPTTREKMQEAMRRTGMNNKEYENLSMLNYLAGKIQDMDCSMEQLEAMIAYGTFTGSVEELINLIDNKECFLFLPNVKSDYDLGYAYAENSGLFTEALKSLGMLANYIDYEAYGRDIRLKEGGKFTEYGYIVKTDNINISFDSTTDKILEEYCL